jgi:hypothetical protein
VKIDAAMVAIVNAWDSGWVAIYGSPPSVPYVLDNEQYTEQNPPIPWVRLAIRHLTGGPMSQGKPSRYRRQGVIMVQVFTLVDQGRKTNDGIVANVIQVLEVQTIGALTDCVTTYGASVRESPADGQWALNVVSVPFDYWELK